MGHFFNSIISSPRRIRFVVTASFAWIWFVLEKQSLLRSLCSTANESLESSGRRETVDVEQLAAAMPRARVDPPAIREAVDATSVQDGFVHGLQKPLAVRVDEGGRLVVPVLVGVVEGLLGEEAGLDFV